jgi:hypothetical protein
MPRFRSLGTAALAVLPALPMSASVGLAPAHVALARPARPAPLKLDAQTWNLEMTRHFGNRGNAGGFAAILVTGGRLWAFGGTNPGAASAPLEAGRPAGRSA